MENKFFFVRKREISGLGSGDWNFFQRRKFCAEKAALEGCLFCCAEKAALEGCLFCCERKGCAGGLLILLRGKII